MFIKIISNYLDKHQKSKTAFYADKKFETVENYRLLLKLIYYTIYLFLVQFS